MKSICMHDIGHAVVDVTESAVTYFYVLLKR